METNALNYAYGAILLQKQADNQHHPMGFMSKSMTPAKQNYRIPDKEALAIIKGLQNWRHWLKHMKLPVQILTDHKNLKYFMKPWVLDRQQMCWLELLTHYNYEIHYCPRDKNCTTNVLSQCAELRPLDREDEKPLCLIPKLSLLKLLHVKQN